MNTKIDEKQLRACRRAGLSYKEIAANFGVTPDEVRTAFESLWDGPKTDPECSLCGADLSRHTMAMYQGKPFVECPTMAAPTGATSNGQ